MKQFLGAIVAFLAGTAGATTYTPFSLKLVTSEPRIEKGRLVEEGIAKRYPVNAALVARSRRVERLSTDLLPRLSHTFNLIEQRTPKEAYFTNERGRWVARQQTGWVVDRRATKNNVLRAIAAGKNEADVVLRRVEPKRSVRDWAREGILFHVSSGESNFTGSPSFRVKNILVGAKKLEERYVKPGEEFDFNAYVGEINEENGFVKGYVISDGTLAKEDGGGICQVSATVFRAAYEGGFPITERHEHSHRVKYYDPVGYEATVYAPEKNFKFRNDTKAPLFIQASWDLKRDTLRFDLFGARSTRKVTVSRPVVTSFKPPAKSSYTAERNQAKGTKRLLDSPMQGMKSVITRRVVQANGKVRKDRTVSVYRPWGAVYAVHPSDSRVN